MAGPVGRRQGYSSNLGVRSFLVWWQALFEGDGATTAIWELVVFWWQTQLEGDRATTAIWELEFLGDRPGWKMTGLHLQSGFSRFSLVASWKASGLHLHFGELVFTCGLAQFNFNVWPVFSWRQALENSLSVALSTLLAGQPMYVLGYCAAVSGSEMEWDGVACFLGLGLSAVSTLWNEWALLHVYFL